MYLSQDTKQGSLLIRKVLKTLTSIKGRKSAINHLMNTIFITYVTFLRYLYFEIFKFPFIYFYCYFYRNPLKNIKKNLFIITFELPHSSPSMHIIDTSSLFHTYSTHCSTYLLILVLSPHYIYAVFFHITEHI